MKNALKIFKDALVVVIYATLIVAELLLRVVLPSLLVIGVWAIILMSIIK